MPQAKPERKDLQYVGESAIIYTNPETGEDTLLGYLLDCGPDNGVYDSAFGKMDITPEEAKVHNSTLSDMLIKGLDGCEIGQCGSFYLTTSDDKKDQVTTFDGRLVSDKVKKKGPGRYEFRYGEKVFRGIKIKDGQMFHFSRVA